MICNTIYSCNLSATVLSASSNPGLYYSCCWTYPGITFCPCHNRLITINTFIYLRTILQVPSDQLCCTYLCGQLCRPHFCWIMQKTYEKQTSKLLHQRLDTSLCSRSTKKVTWVTKIKTQIIQRWYLCSGIWTGNRSASHEQRKHNELARYNYYYEIEGVCVYLTLHFSPVFYAHHCRTEIYDQRRWRVQRCYKPQSKIFTTFLTPSSSS